MQFPGKMNRTNRLEPTVFKFASSIREIMDPSIGGGGSPKNGDNTIIDFRVWNQLNNLGFKEKFAATTECELYAWFKERKVCPEKFIFILKYFS